MKYFVTQISLILSLFLFVPGAFAAPAVLTLLDADTATTGTAIEANATVCESDAVYYETNATTCETDGAGGLLVSASVPHGLVSGNSVVFAAGTGATCTGITAGTNYFVSERVNAKQYNISTTAGGANIAYTDAGTAFNSARTTLRVQTVAVHGLLEGESVSFAAGTGSVCTGITASNVYYATHIDSTTEFNISTTPTGVDIPYTDTGTAFTSNTSGFGSPGDMGNTYDDFTCVVTWGGTAPTNTTIIVYGGIDGLNYTQLKSATITATGSNFTVNNYTSTYLLGEFSAKTGGDATTAVTLICQPGRN